MIDMSYQLKDLNWLGKILKKKFSFSTIPKYLNSIEDKNNDVNIKVIYWKLDYKNSPKLS